MRSDRELVVQRSELQPVDPREKCSTWERFIDGLRTAVGFKPIYLAERFAGAKVLQEEADAEARLLAAKGAYERDMAEARKIMLDAEAQHAKGMAEADLVNVVTEIVANASNPHVVQLLQAVSQNPQDAMKRLKEVLQQFQAYGGVVEFDLPEEDSGE